MIKLRILIITFCLLITSLSDQKSYRLETFSSDSVEYSLSFTENRQEAYFARSSGSRDSGEIQSSIFSSTLKNKMWSLSKPVSLSKDFDDSDPYISETGATLLFSPNIGDGKSNKCYDIFIATKDNFGQWNEPRVPIENISSAYYEYSPRIDGKGNIFFGFDGPMGFGQGDPYVSFRTGENSFGPAVNLRNTVNSKFGEWNVEINPEADILIFEGSQRKTNISSYGNLYITFKRNEKWYRTIDKVPILNQEI